MNALLRREAIARRLGGIPLKRDIISVLIF